MSLKTRRLVDSESEKCQRCGHVYGDVWWADEDLWIRTTGGGSALHCPPCFEELAHETGVALEWRARTLYDFTLTADLAGVFL
jgi:hypothetical protein